MSRARADVNCLGGCLQLLDFLGSWLRIVAIVLAAIVLISVPVRRLVAEDSNFSNVEDTDASRLRTVERISRSNRPAIVSRKIPPIADFVTPDWLRDAVTDSRISQSNGYQRPTEDGPTFRLRGRLEVDILGADQSPANRAAFGNLPDTGGFRRARIGAEGQFNADSRYVAEIDLASGQVVLRDIYVGVKPFGDNLEIRMGHLREPFSLEGGTSANSFAFMERSAINSLDPARNWGAELSHWNADETQTFAIGAFHSGTGPTDLQEWEGSDAAVTVRGTVLPWYEDHGERLMHLGLALSERIPDQGIVVITQRPNSPLLGLEDSSTSPFVPTVKIPANFQQLINAQWALVNGPFWSQAEWYGSLIDQRQGPTVFLHGSHIDVGYFLTGEHRSYLTKSGVFGTVDVKKPLIAGFSSSDQGHTLGNGAWELTARMARLDYNDNSQFTNAQGQSAGANMSQATVGLNWYLADQLRLMFNYTCSIPELSNSGTSSASVFGCGWRCFGNGSIRFSSIVVSIDGECRETDGLHPHIERNAFFPAGLCQSGMTSAVSKLC